MEHSKIIITQKDGFIWTQIFNKKDESVSTFISNHEIEALNKAKKFLMSHKEYCVVCKELDNYNLVSQ